MYKDIYRKITGKKSRPHVVIKWHWWFGNYTGFTLGFIIFVKDRKLDHVIVHELVHVEQFYKQPFTFWIRYLFELYKNGYKNNKYEIEAYKIESGVK